MGVTVEKRQHESVGALIKRFTKQVQKSGLMEELRYREFYVKPSLRKKYPKKKIW
jgi:ribosomal protein S21|tara:strand:- start:180 stop:344 length:165 start_codon:yes stop_codon:yes gene_type:complete